MNAVTYFADALSRERPLTAEETSKLIAATIRTGSHRLWKAGDDRELAKLRRKGLTAEEIATHVGRTAWAVRSRIRTLNRKEKQGG